MLRRLHRAQKVIFPRVDRSLLDKKLNVFADDTEFTVFDARIQNRVNKLGGLFGWKFPLSLNKQYKPNISVGPNTRKESPVLVQIKNDNSMLINWVAWVF